MATMTMQQVPLPQTCQRAALNGTNCHYASYGFVVRDTDTPEDIYRTRIVLCKQCCTAVAAEQEDSDIYTVEEMQEMMEEGQEDMPASSVPEMTLAEVAAKLQAALAKREAETAPKAEEAPQVEQVSTPVVAVPKAEDTPRQTAPSVALETLRHEAAMLHAEAQKLYEQADLLPAAGAVLRDAARKLQKQAEQKERECKRVQLALKDPTYLFAQASSLRSALVLQHGAGILTHVEALVQAGIVTVSQGALVVASRKAPAAKTTERQAGVAGEASHQASAASADNAERNARVVHLRAQGYTGRKIAEMVGLTEGQVSGILHRSNHRAA
jgi:hypothetical protein